jgi:hypothetical protein
MPDPPRYPDSGEDTGAGPEHESGSSSLWTKVLIVIFGLVFLVVVILHLLTGGPGSR